MSRELIDAWLDARRDDMVEDVKNLVKIDSQRTEALPGKPYGEGAAKAVAAAEELMKGYGFKVTNYDNYVVTGDFGGEEKALDILAHLDVVPVTEDWTVTAPFEPIEKDGKLYGRGTADDKGPAVAAIYAVRAIKELGLPMKKGVRIILGSDEECGSSDLEYYYSKEVEAPYTFSPDADFPLINVEKARLAKTFCAETTESDALPRVLSFNSGAKVNVVPANAEVKLLGASKAEVEAAAQKVQEATGVAFTVAEEADVVTVSAKGVAAHGSTPEHGKNALVAMLVLVKDLQLAQTEGLERLLSVLKLFPYGDTTGEALGVAMSDEVSGALSSCLSILNYDGKVLEGAFDMRAPICATNENLTDVVRSKMEAEKITMEAGELTPAHYVPEDSRLVQTLLESYELYTGIKGKPLYTGGGTYVHELERGVAFGCATVGVDNRMHGDDEFMEIDVIVKSAKIFADAILKLCN